jgi:hypothetical protein
MMRAALSAASILKTALVLILASAPAPRLVFTVGARNSQAEPAASAEASARGGQAKVFDEFKMAAGTPAEAPAAFEFESSGFSYRVAANGNGRRTKGDKTRRYNLHLGGGGESIRRLYFSEYEDDLLLLCEVGGGEDGPSVLITRLQQPSMRALWKQSAPSDGVDVLRRGGSLYLGGAGFVARLELKNGVYAWRHRDRREDTGEESDGDGSDDKEHTDEREHTDEAEALIPGGRYVPAEVSGDAVVFRPARGAAGLGTKTVRVDRKTGKIISVE